MREQVCGAGIGVRGGWGVKVGMTISSSCEKPPWAIQSARPRWAWARWRACTEIQNVSRGRVAAGILPVQRAIAARVSCSADWGAIAVLGRVGLLGLILRILVLGLLWLCLHDSCGIG
jgi:hypothetical protein